MPENDRYGQIPRQRRRQVLGNELRRLRDLAGLSGTGVASKVGISQPTLSRIEAGTRLPSVPEVNAWATACGATAEKRADLVDLAEAAYLEVETYSEAVGDGQHLQGRAAEMEQTARTLRTFEPIVVPGLLQTAEYARRTIALSPGSRDDAAALAARIDRQQILYSSGDRSFEFLLTEAAIRWPAGPPAVLVGQLDRLMSLASLAHVRIGVLPIDHEPAAIGWHEFTIYEDAEGAAYVHAELAHVMLTINDPVDVARYQTMYERLSQSALFDHAAARFVQQIADSLRD